MTHKPIEAIIFDLDGVLVDTARFHFLCWERLVKELGISGFTSAENEKLKGISRIRSVEMILEFGGLDRTESEILEIATRKNGWYLEYISTLSRKDVLPGVIPLLDEIRTRGLRIGLGSASKNARRIVDQVGIMQYFEGIVDGTNTTNPKPDPEVFVRCAAELNVEPENCVVFEDAAAGVEAAKGGGMIAVGVGNADILYAADHVVPSLEGMTMDYLESALVHTGE